MHFYTHDGTPCHTQPTKPGAKNPTRPTAISDAKAQNLLGSVTTILGIKKNDALINWLVRMGIETALESQRRPGEEMWKFVNRIKYESTQKSRDATDYGSLMHEELETWNLSFMEDGVGRYECPPDTDPIVSGTLEYWKHHARENLLSILQAERVVACAPLGIAGTVDLFAERIGIGLTIEDYKTSGSMKKDKDGNKQATFWDSFPIQLALYARMVKINDGLTEDPRIVSHVLDSTEPSPPYTKIYTVEEQEMALEMGLTLTKAWLLDNAYRPDGVDVNELNWTRFFR